MDVFVYQPEPDKIGCFVVVLAPPDPVEGKMDDGTRALLEDRAMADRFAWAEIHTVPPGATWVRVDPTSLPSSDHATWSIAKGEIVVNPSERS